MEKISLTSDTISHEDIDALCDWLKTYPKLTKGDLTVKFEEKFANHVCAKYAVFVNSGSSANLLMLTALRNSGLLKIGDAVGVPALCWSTDLAPVLQLGLKPVLLDCSTYNLGIATEYLESIINEFNIKCIISVSVLGILPNIYDIENICLKNNVLFLQDNCESLGSVYQNVPLALFGDMSSWSTYFSHHISTIEGGLVTTNNEHIYELLKSIRSHGWKRDNKRCTNKIISDKNGIIIEVKNDESFYFPYMFHTSGYNIRNTEIGAFLGLRQLDKLSTIVETRSNNYETFIRLMNQDKYKPLIHDDFIELYKLVLNNIVSNFGFPIILPSNRDEVAEYIKSQNIECRPLIAGNIARHPVCRNNQVENTLCTKYADIIHNNGMYLPNHCDITSDNITYMLDKLLEGYNAVRNIS